MKTLCRVCLTLFLFAAMMARIGAEPMGTGFTYQGKIQQGGLPINGAMDLQFSLFDTGSAEIGNIITLSNVAVANGLFTVQLNTAGEFGPNAFNGEKRWLQIAVRHAGTGDYTALTQRQELTPVPYASYAPGPWVANGTTLSYTAGSVGIGKIPDTKLEVADGRIRLRESATLERWDFLYDPPTQKFYIQENVAFNHLVISPGADGAIGMGTDNPSLTARLHVVSSTAGNQAIIGDALSNGVGVFGRADVGAQAIGVWGTSSANVGVYGTSAANTGIFGTGAVNGVRGVSSGASAGVYGRSDADAGQGVYGRSDKNNSIGVFGEADAVNSTGVYGNSTLGIGVQGNSTSSGIGVYGRSNGTGVYAITTGAGPALVVDANGFYAGSFVGNVNITGNLAKSSGSFRIDHPLDPTSKYLFHSFVESPDMMNVYNGNVTTDASGYAEITMPDWFEALNKDFRYQLTVLDDADSSDFAQAKIVKKMQNKRFSIRTSQPKVEVSWQVTGIRQDPWANAHRIKVEEDKPDNERGTYLAPEVYGKPRSMSASAKNTVYPSRRPKE